MNIWSKDFRQRCQNSLGPWDLQIFRADWCSKVFIPSLKKLTFIKQIIHAGKLKWLGEEKGAFWMTLHWTSSWFSHGFKSQPKAFATGEVCAVPLRGAVQWTRNLWRECLDGALWTGAMMGRVFLELMISQTAKPWESLQDPRNTSRCYIQLSLSVPTFSPRGWPFGSSRQVSFSASSKEVSLSAVEAHQLSMYKKRVAHSDIVMEFKSKPWFSG